jgi:hypothetical protein
MPSKIIYGLGKDIEGLGYGHGGGRIEGWIKKGERGGSREERGGREKEGEGGKRREKETRYSKNPLRRMPSQIVYGLGKDIEGLGYGHGEEEGEGEGK